MERDYIADMRKVIDAEAVGSYVTGILARDIVAKLRAEDPRLLTGWLDVQAESFIRLAINERDRSQRTSARYSGPRSAFAADAEAAEAGEPERLTAWLNVRFTVADGMHTPLRDLTREDLLYVADTYKSRARENAMTAAFLRAVARKVRKGTVADHFTDDQLTAMWASVSGD